MSEMVISQTPMQKTKKILLIDENPNDATFVANLLGRHLVPVEISLVADTDSFASVGKRKKWDLILAMAPIGWADTPKLLQTARRHWSGAKVLVMASAVDETLVREMLRQGLADFVAVIRDDLRGLAETVLGALAVSTGVPVPAEPRRQWTRSPVGFFRCFADGRLFDCNDGLARMLGFESREPVMLTNHVLTRAESFGPAKERSVLPGETTTLRLEHREGKARWGRLCLCPVKLSGDSPVAYEGWVQDITAHRLLLERLRQQRAILHAVLESSPVATAILGTDGIIQQANPEFVRLACSQNEKLPGAADYFSFVSPKDRERVKRNHRARIAGKHPPENYVYEFVNRYGETRQVRLGARFVHSQRCTVATHVDLTEQRRKEIGFRQLAQGLAEDRPDIMDGLLSYLGQALGVEAVVLARTNEAETGRLEAMAVWMDGHSMALPAMPVASSAFAKLLSGLCQFAVCTEAAQATYPEDRWLEAMRIEAFVGLPVMAPAGAAVGLIAMARHAPLSNIRFCKAALRIVARRAATEIAKCLAPAPA